MAAAGLIGPELVQDTLKTKQLLLNCHPVHQAQVWCYTQYVQKVRRSTQALYTIEGDQAEGDAPRAPGQHLVDAGIKLGDSIYDVHNDLGFMTSLPLWPKNLCLACP